MTINIAQNKSNKILPKFYELQYIVKYVHIFYKYIHNIFIFFNMFPDILKLHISIIKIMYKSMIGNQAMSAYDYVKLFENK